MHIRGTHVNAKTRRNPRFMEPVAEEGGGGEEGDTGCERAALALDSRSEALRCTLTLEQGASTPQRTRLALRGSVRTFFVSRAARYECFIPLFV